LFPKQIYQIENQKFFPLPHLHQHFRFLLSWLGRTWRRCFSISILRQTVTWRPLS
jgi:hypothetical protein